MARRITTRQARFLTRYHHHRPSRSHTSMPPMRPETLPSPSTWLSHLGIRIMMATISLCLLLMLTMSPAQYPHLSAMNPIEAAHDRHDGAKHYHCHHPETRKRYYHHRAQQLDFGHLRAARDLLRGRVKPKWIEAAGFATTTPQTLRWPVNDGGYVRGFGSGTGGYHLAVDIHGDMGADVHAAAPGIVAYAGNKVRGFGNIVMLVHSGGWVTMYAHNQKNLVIAGEVVSRGQRIAQLGSTGISRGPHVHFELMHDGKNCDPMPLFRQPFDREAGMLSFVTPMVWRVPTQRPAAIECHHRRRHPHSRYHAKRPHAHRDAQS